MYLELFLERNEKGERERKWSFVVVARWTVKPLFLSSSKNSHQIVQGRARRDVFSLRTSSSSSLSPLSVCSQKEEPQQTE